MMQKEVVKVYCSVKPELKRWILLRGTVLAGVGALLIALSSIYVPEKLMAVWGIWIWILSLVLIAVGLVPYKKMAQLETTPHMLAVMANDESSLCFSSRGSLRWSISLKKIEKCIYLEQGSYYGLGLCLRKGTALPLTQSRSNEHFCRTNGCDLFIPFFTQRASTLLSEHLPFEGDDV